MKPITAIRDGIVALVLGLGSAVTMKPASTLYAAIEPPRGRIEVTSRDVDASNAKVQAAYNALIDMWSADFKQIGDRFDAPRIARYRSPVRTPCGVMLPGNAGYCSSDNTIYFDDIFVAAQAKVAANALGTDGDMAGLGVMASSRTRWDTRSRCSLVMHHACRTRMNRLPTALRARSRNTRRRTARSSRATSKKRCSAWRAPATQRPS